MCSMYWNLMADVACPKCGTVERRELQTHWMGEVGSCTNRYELGQAVEELQGIEGAVVPNDELFITTCQTCPTENSNGFFFHCGAMIEYGAVVRVWEVALDGQQPCICPVPVVGGDLPIHVPECPQWREW